jgi:hypothetical protein
VTMICTMTCMVGYKNSNFISSTSSDTMNACDY